MHHFPIILLFFTIVYTSFKVICACCICGMETLYTAHLFGPVHSGTSHWSPESVTVGAFTPQKSAGPVNQGLIHCFVACLDLRT